MVYFMFIVDPGRKCQNYGWKVVSFCAWEIRRESRKRCGWCWSDCTWHSKWNRNAQMQIKRDAKLQLSSMTIVLVLVHIHQCTLCSSLLIIRQHRTENKPSSSVRSPLYACRKTNCLSTQSLNSKLKIQNSRSRSTIKSTTSIQRHALLLLIAKLIFWCIC